MPAVVATFISLIFLVCRTVPVPFIVSDSFTLRIHILGYLTYLNITTSNALYYYFGQFGWQGQHQLPCVAWPCSFPHFAGVGSVAQAGQPLRSTMALGQGVCAAVTFPGRAN